MTIQFKKTTVTIKNSLYGDRDVTAYAKNGLAAAQIGRGAWNVVKVSDGAFVYGRLQCSTMKRAKETVDALLMLIPDWTPSLENPEFHKKFAAIGDDIRRLADAR